MENWAGGSSRLEDDWKGEHGALFLDGAQCIELWHPPTVCESSAYHVDGETGLCRPLEMVIRMPHGEEDVSRDLIQG